MPLLTCSNCLAKFTTAGSTRATCPTCGARIGGTTARRPSADDRPIRKPSRRRDDDDDDDDYDRPVRRKKASSGSNTMLYVLLGGGALLLCGVLGICLVGYFVASAAEKEERQVAANNAPMELWQPPQQAGGFGGPQGGMVPGGDGFGAQPPGPGLEGGQPFNPMGFPPGFQPPGVVPPGPQQSGPPPGIPRGAPPGLQPPGPPFGAQPPGSPFGPAPGPDGGMLPGGRGGPPGGLNPPGPFGVQPPGGVPFNPMGPFGAQPPGIVPGNPMGPFGPRGGPLGPPGGPPGMIPPPGISPQGVQPPGVVPDGQVPGLGGRGGPGGAGPRGGPGLLPPGAQPPGIQPPGAPAATIVTLSNLRRVANGFTTELEVDFEYTDSERQATDVLLVRTATGTAQVSMTGAGKKKGTVKIKQTSATGKLTGKVDVIIVRGRTPNNQGTPISNTLTLN